MSEVCEVCGCDSHELCEKCGKIVHVGDWPFCPHGKVTHFGEEPMEPYLDWNLDKYGPGVEITTRAQRRKIMDANELDYAKPRNKHGKVMYFDQGR